MAASVIGALRVVLGIDTAAFTKGLSLAQAKLQKVGAQMQAVGKTMSRALTLPIAGMGAAVLKVSGDFEQAMNKVGAVSGATGSQLEALREAAKEMGRTTQFSASQAADALSFLAMAGFDADKSIAALPGTLQLAAAANMDLGRAADIVSNVLTGYRKEASDLGHINDVLVKTFTSTNTNLEQLGEAMKYAAPVASAAGVSFEEASAALGLMGNAGIQASMAGTSLRGAISRMLAPTNQMRGVMKELGVTFTDAKGRLLPLDQIIQQLEPHADDAGAMMQLFGLRAGPAFAALVSQGSDALRELTGELQNAGGIAEQIASAQMQGLNGEIKKLKSAFEALLIAIGESGFLGVATRLVAKLTEMVSALAEANPAVLKFGTIVAGVAAVAGPLLIALGGIAIVAAAIAPPILALVGIVSALAVAVGMLTVASGEYEAAAYDAEKGTVALNNALGVFYTTAAPGAAREAIELANSNYELAESAFAAARAEVAKQRAMVEAAKAAAGGGVGSFRELGISASQEEAKLRVSIAQLEKASAALDQASRDRDRAARTVTGRMAEEMTAVAEAAGEVTVKIDGLNGEIADIPDGAGGAGKAADKLGDDLKKLGKDALTAEDDMKTFMNRLDDMQDMGKFVVNSGEALQQSLSDFLFDPFKDGLRGMVLGFSNALRRMASDAIAARLTQLIFGAFGFGGGGFSGGAILGGPSGAFFADGTNYAPGGMAVVGERGPEIVNLPRGSQVIPNHEIGGGATKVVVFDDKMRALDALNTPEGDVIFVDLARRNGVI